jgi:hypothetical protein
VSTREEYLIVVPEGDREAAGRACAEVLTVLNPDLRRATVDAFSDYRDLDSPVAEAFDELRRRASNPENAMALPLDLSDPVEREILLRVAAWTIHAEVFGPDGELATFHDCSSVVMAHLTSDQADVLAHQLRPLDGVNVVTVEDWRRQRAAGHRHRGRFTAVFAVGSSTPGAGCGRVFWPALDVAPGNMRYSVRQERAADGRTSN